MDSPLPLARLSAFFSRASHAPESPVPASLNRLQTLVSEYLRPEDIEKLQAAYHFSAEAHEGQFRISGEPYVSHPVAVAEILAGWHLDAQALTAALLHDVMEDTNISKQEIADRFGKTTAELVDGLSKLDKIEFQSKEDAQAENFRKMLLAMAQDVRVILIKLADRLHNMRTLDAVRPDKRRRIAAETMDIYAPIANRLGLNSVFRDLQELSFQHAMPMRYRVLERALKAARGNRREVVSKILDAIKHRLPECNVQAEVEGREKGLYSIYRKMREKHLSFSQVLDIYGFRVIVQDIPSCYLAMGALHGLYKPVPGKFKDYIAIPKANGYQSLHTTLIGPYGTPVEIQIRTTKMHQVSQSGVASHWLYKDNDGTLNDLQVKTHKWLQSLLELQSTSPDSAEFLEHVKVDLFPDEVYVFSPQGKIFALPRGATPVDFAYAVHTDVGNCCVACRINMELMPLRTELRNGDQVEIVTASHPNPNPAWLSYVKTGKARAQIRHHLKTAQQEQAATLGERMLGQALRAHGLNVAAVGQAVWERFLKEFGPKLNRKEVLTDIGLGKRLSGIVARRLAELQMVEGEHNDVIQKPKPAGSLLIRGSEGVAVQLARCCRPIPGDPIVGLVKKGQGLVVHTHDCPLLVKSRGERDKWVDVDWEFEPGRSYEVAIRAVASNQPGVLAKLAAAIAEGSANIAHVSMDDERGAYTSLYFTLQVIDRIHLARVMRNMRHVPEVVRINRSKGENPERNQPGAQLY